MGTVPNSVEVSEKIKGQLPPNPPGGRDIHTPGFWEEFKSLFTKSGYDPMKIAPHHLRPPPMPRVKPARKDYSEVEANLRAEHPGLNETYEAYQHAKLQYEMMLKLVSTQNAEVEEMKIANNSVRPTIMQPRGGRGFSD